MQVKAMGKRGLIFSFDMGGSPTNVYVIEGEHHRFICDTFLGPYAMKRVLSHCIERHGEKPSLVFNSHAHWDHIWGNVLFESGPIIGHSSSPEIIRKDGPEQLKEYGRFAQGEVRLVPPDTTFTDRLEFADEGVVFFHTPGHTSDSSSCHDLKDNILFVGDNLEEPIPYIFHTDLDGYVTSLETYVQLKPAAIVMGHGNGDGNEILQRNLQYVRSFRDGQGDELIEQGAWEAIHRVNTNFARENEK